MHVDVDCSSGGADINIGSMQADADVSNFVC